MKQEDFRNLTLQNINTLGKILAEQAKWASTSLTFRNTRYQVFCYVFEREVSGLWVEGLENRIV
jgi:hypothetical protein